MKALLHSIYDQPDAEAVHAQFDRILDALIEKLPAVADYLPVKELVGIWVRNHAHDV